MHSSLSSQSCLQSFQTNRQICQFHSQTNTARPYQVMSGGLSFEQTFVTGYLFWKHVILSHRVPLVRLKSNTLQNVIQIQQAAAMLGVSLSWTCGRELLLEE